MAVATVDPIRLGTGSRRGAIAERLEPFRRGYDEASRRQETNKSPRLRRRLRLVGHGHRGGRGLAPRLRVERAAHRLPGRRGHRRLPDVQPGGPVAQVVAAGRQPRRARGLHDDVPRPVGDRPGPARADRADERGVPARRDGARLLDDALPPVPARGHRPAALGHARPRGTRRRVLPVGARNRDRRLVARRHATAHRHRRAAQRAHRRQHRRDDRPPRRRPGCAGSGSTSR